MIRVFSEQLSRKIKRILHCRYLLIGNDLFLLKESTDYIFSLAKLQQFTEYTKVTLNSNEEWNRAFSLCKERSLFAIRQILLIILPNDIILNNMEEKFYRLISLLHENLLLILQSNISEINLRKEKWFNNLIKDAVLISCNAPNYKQLPNWIFSRAKNMNLCLNHECCQLLCHYYEGNLSALVQLLKQLLLIYSNKNFSVSNIECIINNVSQFTIYHWIDAILARDSMRSIHILHQFQSEEKDPIILLRYLQKEILQLITFKRKIMDNLSIDELLDCYNIWETRKVLLKNFLDKTTTIQLQDSITLMTKIEVLIKQDYKYFAWPDLHLLSYLLCGRKIPLITFQRANKI